MPERPFYLDCTELKKLVDSLHVRTRIGDLAQKELQDVFVPPLNLPPGYDLTEPGAIITAVVGTPPVFDWRQPSNAKMRIITLYKRHCLEKE